MPDEMNVYLLPGLVHSVEDSKLPEQYFAESGPPEPPRLISGPNEGEAFEDRGRLVDAIVNAPGDFGVLVAQGL
jgi:hypothetical protein